MRGQEGVRVGTEVRVRQDLRSSNLRGMIGKVVGSYGAHELMALAVHFPNGRCQLFWPGDLEDVASPMPWWRSLFRRRRRRS